MQPTDHRLNTVIPRVPLNTITYMYIYIYSHIYKYSYISAHTYMKESEIHKHTHKCSIKSAKAEF